MTGNQVQPPHRISTRAAWGPPSTPPVAKALDGGKKPTKCAPVGDRPPKAHHAGPFASFVVTPRGDILPEAAYNPSEGHILVWAPSVEAQPGGGP